MSFKKIGTVLKPFRLEGRLLIRLENVDTEFLCSLKNVYLGTAAEVEDVAEINGIQERGNKIILTLKEVQNRNDAEKLRGTGLFLPEDILKDNGSQPEEVTSLTGYSVLNSKGKVLGKIRRIDSYPAQEMLIMQNHEKEWMIPLVEEYIVSIEPEEGVMILDLPEGLVDED